jgi:hypothetical protein
MKKLLLLLLMFCFYFNVKSQAIFWFTQDLADMPMPISNNAVVEGWSNNTPYIYSFGGIDSTKIWSGITKKSFRYNTFTNVWDTIPDLPNTNSVIAAGASYVDSIIYIIGGYQVLSNGNEISSNIVNRYDPRTNTYLSDGTTIPVPIDDHVQAVYNDSLIYVITGWSNSGNVPNIQIYDPLNDNWLTGTSVPNNNTFKAFGASGSIVGNTIYYHGGASTGFNFPGQSNLRIGKIDSTNPTQITWSNHTFTNPEITYRSIAIYENIYNNQLHWLGGSNTTYNYNGIAYNGTGGVNPRTDAVVFDTTFNTSGIIPVATSTKIPMDLRGVASLGNSYYIVAGGMLQNQKVSNKTISISIGASSILENINSISFKVFPNPTSNEINIVFENNEHRTIQLLDVLGNEILTVNNKKLSFQLDVSNYPKGIYLVKVTKAEETSSQKIIVQ